MADALTAAIAEVVRTVIREELAAMLAQMRPMEEPRELGESLTVAEAARELCCTPRHVRRLISIGRIQATKLGSAQQSRVLVSRESIARAAGKA